MLRFNTQRPYSCNGQIITAITHLHGVLFKDHARNIAGFIPMCPLEREAIMKQYDDGNYQYCSLANDLPKGIQP